MDKSGGFRGVISMMKKQNILAVVASGLFGAGIVAVVASRTQKQLKKQLDVQQKAIDSGEKWIEALQKARDDAIQLTRVQMNIIQRQSKLLADRKKLTQEQRQLITDQRALLEEIQQALIEKTNIIDAKDEKQNRNESPVNPPADSMLPKMGQRPKKIQRDLIEPDGEQESVKAVSTTKPRETGAPTEEHPATDISAEGNPATDEAASGAQVPKAVATVVPAQNKTSAEKEPPTMSAMPHENSVAEQRETVKKKRQLYVFQYDADFQVVGKFGTIMEASKAAGLRTTTGIYRVLGGKCNYTGGYFWSRGYRPLKKIPEKWKAAALILKKEQSKGSVGI